MTTTFPDEDPRVGEVNDGTKLPTLFYIDGVAYTIESYGEPESDGSRKATLRVWKPF